MDFVRQMAIDAAYESAAGRMPGITLETFREAVADFEVHPIVVRGETVGALLVSGPEIHACVMPNGHRRWINKALFAVLNAVIDKHGYAQTEATTPAGAAFVEALGFEKQGNIYRSTKKWALKQQS